MSKTSRHTVVATAGSLLAGAYYTDPVEPDEADRTTALDRQEPTVVSSDSAWSTIGTGYCSGYVPASSRLI